MAAYESEVVNQALRGLQHGDRSCAEGVFKALWPIILAFCNKAVGDGGQDVAQETLMELFQQAGDFRDRGDALAWALEIATWGCRTELRRRGRARGPLAPQVLADQNPPDSQLERAQLTAALHQSIAQLSDRDQSVVISLLQESFPSKAGSAARKRKERALTRLKDAWRSLYGAD